MGVQVSGEWVAAGGHAWEGGTRGSRGSRRSRPGGTAGAGPSGGVGPPGEPAPSGHGQRGHPLAAQVFILLTPLQPCLSNKFTLMVCAHLALRTATVWPKVFLIDARVRLRSFFRSFLPLLALLGG